MSSQTNPNQPEPNVQNTPSLGPTTGVTELTAALDRQPIGPFHRRLLVASGLGWMFDAMDVGLISFIIAALVREWGLQPVEAGFISSAGFVGMFAGAAIAGALADRYGRKLLFQSTLVIYSIATGLCALAGSLAPLLVLRFFVGLGLGGELPVASTLVSEFSPAKRRGFMIVILESFWAYGWVLAALIGYFVVPSYGWRVAFLIGSLPAIYILVIRRHIPESPRFLASQGRFAEAEAIVEQVTGESHRLDRADFTSRAKPPRWTDIWRPPYTKRTLMLWIIWFGIVFSYYGVFQWLPSLLDAQQQSLTKAFEYVLIITLAQIPGYFSAAYLVERLGRKWTLASYLLACAIGAFFFRFAGTPTEIILWGSVISFFNLGAWGVVYTYTPELYPTRIRATGAGSAAAFGRIGGIISPYIVGLLLPTWTSGRDVVFGMFASVFLFVALTVAVLGEETKGGSLEEIAQD